jgi:hypothetical protein
VAKLRECAGNRPKNERARYKESQLSAWQQSKFVWWDTIIAEVRDKAPFLLVALDNADGAFTNDDLLQIQRAVADSPTEHRNTRRLANMVAH